MAVANPGCFATAIQLALWPLALHHRLTHTVHITGVTGSTGAGQKLQETSHFSWRQGNLSVYKAFEHQHLHEIKDTLKAAQPAYPADLLFVPMRGPFSRGILCSLYTEIEESLETISKLYREAYEGSPFVHITDSEIHLKQVLNTNHTLISMEKHGPYLHLVVCLDNLVKGASGQALQNMNLMFKRPETEGLLLKPIAF
jgi:N-acetyl-gamma-glutamyl-phosphate reductase